MGRCLAAFTNDPVEEYVRKGEIKARYFNPCDFFDEIHLITPARRDADAGLVQAMAGRARVSVHPLGAPGVLTLPLLLRRAAEIVRKTGAQIVRGHGMNMGGVPAVWAARSNGLPVVVSLHSNEDTDFRALLHDGVLPRSLRTARRAAWLRLFERYVLTKPEAIICRYDSIREYALMHGARVRDTHVIYNWIDVDRFRPGTPRQRSRVRVLSVNRQAPEKNPAALIRAMRRLEHVELVLVGQGSLHDELKALAQSEGVADRVLFIPSAPHAEIHDLYRDADICAVCIQVAGVSMGTMEAMAAGLPIVCSRTPFAERPEVVGDVAIITDPTPEDFAAAIGRLASDPRLRAELGERARARVCEIRGDVMERDEARVYETLLESAAGSVA